MSSLLEHLENNEAVLLMYVAGELPAEDRAEVEQMLSTDANLRQELSDLRRRLDGVAGFVGKADAISRPPVKEQAAVRSTLRAMRQWRLAHPYGAPVPVAPRKGLAYPWWVYPTASAAMIVLAAVVWWGFHNEVADGQRYASDLRIEFLVADPTLADPSISTDRAALASADPLDQAYLELRSIQELSEGM